MPSWMRCKQHQKLLVLLYARVVRLLVIVELLRAPPGAVHLLQARDGVSNGRELVSEDRDALGFPPEQSAPAFHGSPAHKELQK